jgi:hypothetical protein
MAVQRGRVELDRRRACSRLNAGAAGCPLTLTGFHLEGLMGPHGAASAPSAWGAAFYPLGVPLAGHPPRPGIWIPERR